MHATKAAVEEGIVPGGGVALLRAIPALDKRLKAKDLTDDVTHRRPDRPPRLRGADALDRHQRRPGGQHRRGQGARRWTPRWASTPPPTPTRTSSRPGVIDPTKVVRFAIQNAASIAALHAHHGGDRGRASREEEGAAMPPGDGRLPAAAAWAVWTITDRSKPGVAVSALPGRPGDNFSLRRVLRRRNLGYVSLGPVRTLHASRRTRPRRPGGSESR